MTARRPPEKRETAGQAPQKRETAGQAPQKRETPAGRPSPEAGTEAGRGSEERVTASSVFGQAWAYRQRE
ncbi:hypothetical protein Aph02nite_01980 [Actinoplanes philippinensis]|nr:hypothetical protein Aph02nite_01980 [Actinoplanes philippinensis]